MSSSPAACVLVVGAGPSGLVAALVLAQNGVPIRIVDKNATYNVGEQPRTLELHRFLGTYQDIKTQGGPNKLVRVYGVGAGMKPLRTFPMSEEAEPTSGTPDPNLWMLGQDHQEAILRNHLEKLGVKVELGVELTSFTQDAEKVDVVLRHIMDGQEEKATFKWIIGANGAHSSVRKALGLSLLGESRTESGFVIGDLFLKKLGPGFDQHWRVWGDATKKAFSLRPIDGDEDKFAFFCAGPEIDLPKIVSNPEVQLYQTFSDITGVTDVEFGNLVWTGHWRPNIRMVEKLGEGRVFIAGDAAHCRSPTGGQGMNSSVQDATNLAWKLALVENGHSPRSLLDSYSAERLPVIAAMLNKTTELYKRTFATAGVQSDAMERPHALKQLGVTYRGSPIIFESPSRDKQPVDPYRSGKDGKVLPGDRAPDASVGLFDVFKVTHHTVLIFAEDEAFANEALKTVKLWGTPTKTAVIVPKRVGLMELQGDYVFTDEDGSAFDNYRVSGNTVIVVRPDGVIASKSEDIKSLTAYGNVISGTA